MHNININFFTHINNWATTNSFLDNFFVFLTNEGTYLLFALFGIFIFFVAPFIYPKGKRLEILMGAIYILLSVFFTWVIVAILKEIFFISRPFEVLDNVKLLTQADGKSFPSLHASLSMALAVSSIFYYKKLGILFLILSILIGFSRIFVGVHYPFDVLVGFVFGVFIPILSRNFLTFLSR